MARSKHQAGRPGIRILSKTAFQRQLKELIAYLVAEGHLPDPKTLDCHECGEYQAAAYDVFCCAVCRFCRQHCAHAVDVSKLAKQIRGHLPPAPSAAAPKQLQASAAAGAAEPLEGEYLEDPKCRS